ncbi:glutathione S-transferase U8 [Cucumis sativus]|uniref:glutathione transferase n=1 Tax=Cucumis sativus TaxID=3659 RepID=A0A0A0KZS0_CUCSA|nr:glutathione S-transferase U8 [Cucumis sativus]KGN54314.1 hypothetical protein Csa_017953 [Cucumis sativus]
MEGGVEVFGFWPSPFSLRVELALKLKGIQYQYVEEDVLNQKSDLLVKYNPIYKKVPVLVHHGKPISESLVILEYIEETWKHSPILPQDCHEKALARFWAAYIDGKVVSALGKVCGSKGEVIEEAVEEAKEALEPLEKELKSNKFFGGEKIGFLDIVGILIAFWIPASEEALGIEMLTAHKFPNLIQWIEELANDNVVKELIPKKDDLVTHMKTVLGKN